MALKAFGAAVVVLGGTLGLARLNEVRFTPTFPPISASMATKTAQLSDFVGMVLGFRRLACDIAWIQTLVYYGTDEEGMTEEQEHSGGGKYPLFLDYCQRAARIDPQFKYVYFYGGGVLGWNLERLDEAETLLKEGMRVHPHEWRFPQFLAAIAYQKNHNINALVDFLEGFIKEKECPNLLRSILANLYKKQKRYREAVRVWLMVYDTGDPLYLERATDQINQMAPLAGISTPK